MMKKIIATVRAEVWQTPVITARLKLPAKAARMRAPTAPTAPASLGVAQPNRIEPLIMPIRNTGGTNARISSGASSPFGTDSMSGGSGGARDGRSVAATTTKTR